MRVRLALAVVVALVFVACGPASEQTEPGTSTSTTAAVETTSSGVPTTTTTTVPSVPEPLRYFRFDDSGLSFFDGSTESQLVAAPVRSASHDGMGGVLYTVDGWESGLKWTTPGAAEHQTLDYLRGTAMILDGRPMLLAERGTWEPACPETTNLWYLVDLLTGAETPFGCFGGEDGGISIVTGGGSLLVGQQWLAVGALGSDLRIRLYDIAGTQIEHPFNPVPESCAPCELDVRLSPDGSRLAYRLRPDAKWSDDYEERRRLDAMPYEEWWETSRAIAGAVVVLDLDDGEEVFRMTVPAEERLADFDGTVLVLETCGPASCSSRIVDITGAAPEVAMAGRVRLATNVCCMPPVADVFPPLLRVWIPSDGQVVGSRTFRFEGVADPDAQVVAAGRYPVTVAPDGTWSIVLVLNPGGNVATFTATDAAGNVSTVRRAVTYRTDLVLTHEGLSVARFGDPVDDVMRIVTESLGPPNLVEDQDPSDCFLAVRDVRVVTWQDHGLRLTFTDWGGTHEAPVAVPLHFTDWEIIGPGVATDTGLQWGSTVAELRAASAGVLIGINEFAPMFLIPVPSGWIVGGFQWSYEEFWSSLQAALGSLGYDLTITGTSDRPTNQAIFDFIEDQGMGDAVDVLGALGLPSDDVRLGWMHAGRGPLCD